MRAFVLLLVGAFVLAGCVETPADKPTTKKSAKGKVPIVGPVLVPVVENSMNFTEHVVPLVSFAADLYEPTMEVSDTGVIYVTGHTIVADTTGAPVYMSKDDGKTWSQLPFLAEAKMPEPMHGATPPPSDEIFLVAGENGWLYGVDITLLTYPVNAWSGNGARLSYHNPNAYNRVDSTTSVCAATSLNDRPWAAYGKGKLLMVNNAGAGRIEIGVLDVPPSAPVGIGAPIVGARWNPCVTSGGSIPGIPDLRDDHFFVVPQVKQGALTAVLGNAKDVSKVEVKEIFKNTNTGGGTSNYGQAVFDSHGTLFLGIRNNTAPNGNGVRQGRLHVAVSTDDGKTFSERTFELSSASGSLFMDGNMKGPGALITWAQQGDPGWDWYAGHLQIGADGGPTIENVTRLVKSGPAPSAHVQGAAAGPDGRAYLVTFHGGGSPTGGTKTPLHVWIQREGPTLPIEILPAVPVPVRN